MFLEASRCLSRLVIHKRFLAGLLLFKVMTVQPHVTLNLPLASTEYSWTIPAGAQCITFQNREEDTDIQYYFKSNANGGGPGKDGNYFTLRAGNAKTFNANWNGAQVIYFQAVTNTNRNVEIEYATAP